jgi:hypothetical protein
MGSGKINRFETPSSKAARVIYFKLISRRFWPSPRQRRLNQSRPIRTRPMPRGKTNKKYPQVLLDAAAVVF